MPRVSDAIGTWAAADDGLVQLKRLGEAIHDARTSSAGDAWRPGFDAQIKRLDDVLNAEELQLSRQLGKAPRRAQGLLLPDMQLPDMSGLDVLDRPRADPATSGIRVVALSADAMPAQITEAIARGAEAYWTKPLALPRFKSELPKFLR